MQKSKRKFRNSLEAPKSASQEQQKQRSNVYEGERLAHLIRSLEREIELAKVSKGGLPDKIWLKQQFSIGVNDVTRVLERMAPSSQPGNSAQDSDCSSCKSAIQLQAILVASDCNPRWLTKHLPSLATSRKVPLICIKDHKGGSLRLGELVKLKTAIAVGVKVKGSGINEVIAEILRSSNTSSTGCG